jgi:hypothetical protein
VKAILLALSLMSLPAGSLAHSASDAYLDLAVEKNSTSTTTLIHGQWDIALRDLDFVLNLDENGDGQLTWGEVRRQQAAIEKYAYSHLHFEAGSAGSCSIKPIRQMIDNHADGAYAALFFDVGCQQGKKHVMLDYRLFFAIDPSHRAILLIHSGGSVSSALLSPENARVSVDP